MQNGCRVEAVSVHDADVSSVAGIEHQTEIDLEMTVAREREISTEDGVLRYAISGDAAKTCG